MVGHMTASCQSTRGYLSGTLSVKKEFVKNEVVRKSMY